MTDKEIKKFMEQHKLEYVDECDELNYTFLAENCAFYFGKLDDDNFLERCFEIASTIEI